MCIRIVSYGIIQLISSAQKELRRKYAGPALGQGLKTFILSRLKRFHSEWTKNLLENLLKTFSQNLGGLSRPGCSPSQRQNTPRQCHNTAFPGTRNTGIWVQILPRRFSRQEVD